MRTPDVRSEACGEPDQHMNGRFERAVDAAVATAVVHPTTPSVPVEFERACLDAVAALARNRPRATLCLLRRGRA